MFQMYPDSPLDDKSIATVQLHLCCSTFRILFFILLTSALVYLQPRTFASCLRRDTKHSREDYTQRGTSPIILDFFFSHSMGLLVDARNEANQDPRQR